MRTVTIQFEAPFTAMLVGPTGSGKTHFVFKLLEALQTVCTEPPERVVYCYGAWQKRFEEVGDEISFHAGLIDVEDIPNDGRHTVMVIDDLMTELSKSKEAVNFFTKHSHHRKITCIFIVQKLYGSTPELRTISANTHHMFLFKNPRDASSVSRLASQMFPGKVQAVNEAFSDATKHPYTHLMLNMSQKTDVNARVVGNYLSSDPNSPMKTYLL